MKNKSETKFYENPKGEIEYNKICKKCLNECKQSFRTVLISCPQFKPMVKR